MKPRHGPLPLRARPREGRSLVSSGARILVLLLAVRILAGCSTAPSWKTQEQCRSFPDGCAGIPASRIAQDFKALSSAAIPRGGEFADATSLNRLNPSEPRPAYRIGPLDELTITVWGAREIWSEITDQSQQPTRVTTVLEDGTIVLPLLPSVQVNGLTVGEALKKIAVMYRDVLGTSFQVDGQVTKYRSKPVLLDGGVNRPGTVHLSNEIRTLGEALISGSGGFPDFAELSKGVLIRGDRRYAIDYRSAQTGANDLSMTELQPGDRIFFPSRESGIFYVLGEVLAPGAFPIPPKGISLVQGLALARGPNMLKANMESIFLLRVDEKDPKIYRLALGDILANKDEMLVPGDRIFVPSTFLTDWDETIRSLLPGFGLTAAVIYYITGGK